MKAVEYFNKYGEMIFEEAVKGQHATMLEMFSEVYNEIETICKTRNAVRDSAKVSAVKEVNQKWNKIRDLFIKKYTASPIQKDAIQKIFIKENPKAEELFMIEKSPKKFEPADAQKEFDKMSNSMRLMNSLGMLGIILRQKTREAGGEPYENQ